MVKKQKNTMDQEKNNDTLHPQGDTTESVRSDQEHAQEEDAEEKLTKKQKGKKKKGSGKDTEKAFQQQIDELNDKYLRLYSEFDNYRRRTSKEKLELLKTASEELIVELLPVLDDFERALKSAESATDCDAVKEGMDLIFNKMSGILAKKGLEKVESTGKEFDTDFHEAISYIPTEDKKMKGKVMDTVENGYTLGEKVIRYSKVVIGQ